MNLVLSMRANALRFGGVDKNAAKKRAAVERMQTKTKRTRTRQVRKPESGQIR